MLLIEVSSDFLHSWEGGIMDGLDGDVRDGPQNPNPFPGVNFQINRYPYLGIFQTNFQNFWLKTEKLTKFRDF